MAINVTGKMNGVPLQKAEITNIVKRDGKVVLLLSLQHTGRPTADQVELETTQAQMPSLVGMFMGAR